MALHDIYAKLPKGTQRDIDRAYLAFAESVALAGLPLANDDRAERLVEAMAVAVVESNPALKAEIESSVPSDEEMAPAYAAMEEKNAKLRAAFRKCLVNDKLREAFDKMPTDDQDMIVEWAQDVVHMDEINRIDTELAIGAILSKARQATHG